MAQFERDDDMPLSREGMRRIKRPNPTGKVPRELAGLGDGPPSSKRVKFVKTAKAIGLTIPPSLLHRQIS
jgi:hypothetical protein